MSRQKNPPPISARRNGRKPAIAKQAPTQPRKTQAPGPKRGPVGRFLRFILRMIFGLMWRGAAAVVLLLVAAVGFTALQLPPAGALLDGRAGGSVTLMDRDGQVFAWRGQQYAVVTVQTVAPAVRDAVIATEDKRFYRHFGLSPRGIASAIRINLSEGRGPLSGHGGSTITQQTAKLVCLGRAYDPDIHISEAKYEADCRKSTLWRKLSEAVYAMGMELRYTKDEILTIYLNRVFLGAGVHGFEAAMHRYFGKSAAEANVSEAAMLAGLLVAPSRYAPTNNIERSRQRASTVLRLMREQGYLTPSQEALAVANPASLSQPAQARAGGYFADWLMGTGPEYFTRTTTEDVVIETTFDPNLQKAAEEAVAQVFSQKVSVGSKAQVAVVVMSSDGAVRAMVGGRQTGVTGGFNRATLARRQVGSAFKPFVYAAALDMGFGPLERVVDEPITIHIRGSDPWSPKNYSNTFKGDVSLTEAFAESLNIPAVKLSERVGHEAVSAVAFGLGLKGPLAQGPAIALGASEASLLEMTSAYAGILNGGQAVENYGVRSLKLVGSNQAILEKTGGMRERIIATQTARDLTYMMFQTVEKGTGRRAQIAGVQAAGKTGTSQSARDAWFIGFTSDYVAGVWMGNDDNTPLKSVTGGSLPAEIWKAMMERIVAQDPAAALPMNLPSPVQDQVTQNAANMQPRFDVKPTQERGSFIERVLDGIFGR